MFRCTREAGARLDGARSLDSGKVQAPCVVRLDGDRCRMFYTGVGPAKPFASCQGYILSATSEDGLTFQPEEGIRLAPEVADSALRVLAPSVVRRADGDGWRMYFESRGAAGVTVPVIRSAVSADMLHWEHEEGVRLSSAGGLGGPRYCSLPGGGGRLYVCDTVRSGQGASSRVRSALSADGLSFEWEDGDRMVDGQGEHDGMGITAAEPVHLGPSRWALFYSCWQDAPPGASVPLHPTANASAVDDGSSADFAAASIAADMAGYRSRIFTVASADGLAWDQSTRRLAVEGAGYGGGGIDAVHAEDMQLVALAPGVWRMYYAACSAEGRWCVASARVELVG